MFSQSCSMIQDKRMLDVNGFVLKESLQLPQPNIVLSADIKPIVDGEAVRCAASPSISVLTDLRIAINQNLTIV